MLKKARVIMLPTKDKTVLSKSYLANPSYLRYNKNGFKYDSFKNNDNQHLYITTDDEIKEGDWCIKDGKLYQSTGVSKYPNCEDGESHLVINFSDVFSNKQSFHLSHAKKIIATTDVYLGWSNIGACEEGKVIGNHITKSNGCLFIPDVPQLSQEFIEKYCEKGGIDEVMVEWNDFISNNNCNLNDGYHSGVKTDSHNTITIHPIKDSWNRNEVETLILNIVKDISFGSDDLIHHYNGDFKNAKCWIKNNL